MQNILQHILITGGNSGIGKATAIALAQRGAKVIIACRNETKAKEAVWNIKKAAESELVDYVTCDLSDFNSIKSCTENYLNKFARIDVLINNAGLFTDTLQLTRQGFELQFGVNHLGHFLLTHLLLDALQKSPTPRIINMSSGEHYRGKIDMQSFRGEMGVKDYKGMLAYRQSKLANVLFTKELARRYPNIYSHALHPGIVSTEIAQKETNWLLSGFWRLIRPMMMTPEKGAKTSVYLASSAEVLKVNGKYFTKCKEKEPARLAKDETLAKQLWEVSEGMIQLQSKIQPQPQSQIQKSNFNKVEIF